MSMPEYSYVKGHGWVALPTDSYRFYRFYTGNGDLWELVDRCPVIGESFGTVYSDSMFVVDGVLDLQLLGTELGKLNALFEFPFNERDLVELVNDRERYTSGVQKYHLHPYTLIKYA